MDNENGHKFINKLWIWQLKRNWKILLIRNLHTQVKRKNIHRKGLSGPQFTTWAYWWSTFPVGIQFITTRRSSYFIKRADYHTKLQCTKETDTKKVKIAQLCLTLCSPIKSHSPWNSLGQNTGVGSPPHVQGIFPGIKPRSPALQADSSPTEPQGKPKNTGVHSLSLLQWIFPTQESNWGLLHYRWILPAELKGELKLTLQVFILGPRLKRHWFSQRKSFTWQWWKHKNRNLTTKYIFWAYVSCPLTFHWPKSHD